MGVEAQRPRRDRAEHVLAVLHVDQGAGVGLQRVLQHRLLEHHLGVDPLAAALEEVDRRRLLVDAVVARQGDAGHAGRRLDQLAHDPVAGDRRHVHPHGVAGLEAEAQIDRGAERLRLDLGQLEVAAVFLGQSTYLAVVLLDPVEELPRLLNARGPERRRTRHADVLNANRRSTRGRDRPATTVDAGQKSPFGRRHRHPDLLARGDGVAGDLQRTADTERDLRDADKVLAVTRRGPLSVQRVVTDVLQLGAGQPLDRLAANRRLLLGREIRRQSVQPTSPLDDR